MERSHVVGFELEFPAYKLARKREFLRAPNAVHSCPTAGGTQRGVNGGVHGDAASVELLVIKTTTTRVLVHRNVHVYEELAGDKPNGDDNAEAHNEGDEEAAGDPADGAALAAAVVDDVALICEGEGVVAGVVGVVAGAGGCQQVGDAIGERDKRPIHEGGPRSAIRNIGGGQLISSIVWNGGENPQKGLVRGQRATARGINRRNE
jgi:hypothetical protein